MTKGEARVGIGLNPSGDDRVGRIKRMAAGLIDEIEAIEPAPPELAGEVGRCKAKAQTEVEDAVMWAVKAATKRPG